MPRTRPAYTRKGETNREHYTGHKPELNTQDFTDLHAACTTFLSAPRPPASGPPPPKRFVRRWQSPIKEPLAKLLLRAEIAAAVANGKVRRAPLPTEGWADWIHDGDSHDARPALA